MLSRVDGAIVRASGLLTSTAPEPDETTAGTGTNGTESAKTEDADAKKGLKSAEDVARLVWGLFSSAGDFVDEMMGKEDEVRLLRLRMKRNEIVIVPGGLDGCVAARCC